MATTSEVARLLEVSPPTIRTYTQKFGDHLSPQANPGPGQQRTFTDEDVAVLSAARSLLQEGLTYAEATDRLSAVDLSEFAPPEQQQAEVALVPANAVQMIVQPYIEERDRILAERDLLQQEVRELSTELGELRGRLQEVSKPWWQKLLGR
jgi:DNA-binding transcriptional MerR regulator